MTLSGLMRSGSRSSTSYTKAMPPDMPAAKLGPTDPRMTTTPPVMYSQPLEPQPSTTAMASELRTQKRPPAWQAAKSLPEIGTDAGRERSVPYGLTLVGGGTLKKKK